MKKIIILLFSISINLCVGQNYPILQVGDKAPDFILTIGDNTIQSFLMPYMKRITLIHFWSPKDSQAKHQNNNIKRLYQRYHNATYTNAEGFEVISIAVETSFNEWKSMVLSDSLDIFGYGMAARGYDDEVCMKYHVTTTPKDYLVDETGKIAAIDPRITDVETILDNRRNFHSVKNEVVGFLAQSSNKKEVLKFSKLYLFNYYGDSIYKSQTDGAGKFHLHDIKLNQAFVLKVDNQSNFVTSDPIALYSEEGEFIMDGITENGGFVFNISPRLSNKLCFKDTAHFKNSEIGQIDVVKSLMFTENGMGLTPKDIKDINPILSNLQKNNYLKVEFTTHTDTKVDGPRALDITTHQVNAIKSYLEKKGIDSNRISGVAMGNSEPRKKCEGTEGCSESDHKLNRRVEFIMFKD